MVQMHEYGPVVPLFLGILAGIWLNRRDFADLKADTTRQIADLRSDTTRQIADLRSDTPRQIADLRSDTTRQIADLKVGIKADIDRVDSRLTRMEEDQKQFFKITGMLDGRLDELSARVK